MVMRSDSPTSSWPGFARALLRRERADESLSRSGSRLLPWHWSILRAGEGDGSIAQPETEASPARTNRSDIPHDGGTSKTRGILGAARFVNAPRSACAQRVRAGIALKYSRRLQERASCDRTEREKPRSNYSLRGFGNKPGNDLLSHARARAVPSALEGLTSEFGMGSGMAPPTSSPEKLWWASCGLWPGDTVSEERE